MPLHLVAVAHDVGSQYSLAILEHALTQNAALKMVCAANMDLVSLAAIRLLITSPKYVRWGFTRAVLEN